MLKKYFLNVNPLLIVSFLFGQVPIVSAQEVMSPPVVVNANQLADKVGQIEALDRDILNTDRRNRDEEILTRQLAQENILLSQALCERQRTVVELRKQVMQDDTAGQGDIACDDRGILVRLNKVMSDYQKEVIARDKKAIARQDLEQAQARYTEDSKEVISLIKEVEALKKRKLTVTLEEAPKAQAAEQPKAAKEAVAAPVLDAKPLENQALKIAEQRLAEKLAALENKSQVIEEKNAHLEDLKVQLTQINAQLKQASLTYDNTIAYYSNSLAQLKAQWAAEREAKNSTLLDANAQLQNQLNDLQTSHQNAQAEINKLSSQNNYLSDQLQVYKDQNTQGHSALSNQVTQQQEAINLQKTAAEELKRQLAQKDEQLTTLTKQWYGKDGLLLELKNKLTASDAKLSEVDAVMAIKDQQIAQLKVQVIELREQLAAKQQVINLQAKSIQETRLGLEGLKVNVEGMGQILDSNQAAFERIAENVVQLKGLLNRQADELAFKDQEITRLNELVNALQSQSLSDVEFSNQNEAIVDELRSKVRGLKDEFASRIANVSQVESIVKDLRQQLAQSKALILEKDKLITYQQEQLKQKDAELSLSSQKDTRIVQLQEQLRQAIAVAKQGQEQMSSLTALEGRVRLLSQRLEEREAFIAKMKALYQSQDMSLNQQLAMLEAKVDNIKEVKQEVLASQQKALSLEQEKQVALKQGEELKSMLQVYENRIQQKEDKINSQLSQVLLAKKRQVALEAEVAKLSALVADKEQQVVKVKEYFAELEKRYSTKDQDIQAKDLSLSMMQQMVDQKQKEFQQKDEALKLQMQEQVKSVLVLRQELAMKEEQLKASANKEEVIKWQASAQAARQEVGLLTKAVEEKEAAIAQLKAQAALAQSGQEALLKDLNDAKAMLKEAYDRLKMAKDDLEAKQKEIAGLNQKLNTKSQEVQKELVVKGKQVEGREKELEDAKKMIAQFKDALKTTRVELDFRQKEVLRLKDQHKMKEDAWRQEQKKLQSTMLRAKPVVEAKAAPVAKVEAVAKPVIPIKHTIEKKLVIAPDPNIQNELEFLRKDLKAMAAKLDETKAKLAEQDKGDSRYAQENAILKKKLSDAEAKLKSANIVGDYRGLKEALADAHEQIKATNEELSQQKKIIRSLEEKLNKK